MSNSINIPTPQTTTTNESHQNDNETNPDQKEQKEAEFVQRVLHWRHCAMERVWRESTPAFDREVAVVVEEWKEGGEDKEAPRTDRLTEREHALVIELENLTNKHVAAFTKRLDSLYYVHCALRSKPPSEFDYRLPRFPPDEEVLISTQKQFDQMLHSFGFDHPRDRCIEVDELAESERIIVEDLGDAILDRFLAVHCWPILESFGWKNSRRSRTPFVDGQKQRRALRNKEKQNQRNVE